MNEDIFNRLTSQIGKYGAKAPDSRDGHDQKYELIDALKATFGVFFFQFPSVLQFMRAMQEEQKRFCIIRLKKYIAGIVCIRQRMGSQRIITVPWQEQ